MNPNFLRAAALAFAACTVAQGAAAADLKVLTAGAFKPVVVALAPVFEQRTGHRLTIDNDTAGALVRRIAGGEADIAIRQISEILAVPGATLVGPIPADIRNYTVYAGSVGSAARDADAARAFLSLLGGPEAAVVLKAKGMEAP